MSAKRGWSLKRTVQCEKCPWRVETDAHDIPNGYCEKKHAALARTIAVPGSLNFGSMHVMACHDMHDAHCVEWVVNQVGQGNNIALRMDMTSCLNAGKIRLRGEQHQSFKDTLP